MEIFTPQFVWFAAAGLLLASTIGRKSENDESTKLPWRFARPGKNRNRADGRERTAASNERISFSDFVKSGEHATSVRFHMAIPMDILEGVDGSLSTNGQANMESLARVLRRKPYFVTIEVSDRSKLPLALSCIQYLYHVECIDSSRLTAEHIAATHLPINRIGINIYTQSSKASA